MRLEQSAAGSFLESWSCSDYLGSGENSLLVRGYSVGMGGFKMKHESYQDDLRKQLFYCFPNDDCKNYEAMEEELLSMLHASLIMQELSGSKKGSYETPKIRCPFPYLTPGHQPGATWFGK